MPVNAPQFGPGVNVAATPATNSSLFSFLAAGSTNSATPDFKTIAASFFAAPTTTTAAPVETKSTAGAKSAAPFLPRERESNKEKDVQGFELPATFLPAIPVYPHPTLTPQAPRHTEPMPLAEPAQAKTNSPSPICTPPVVNQPQDLAQILVSRSTNRFATKVSSLQQDLKANNVEPMVHATPKIELNNVDNIGVGDKTTNVVKTDAKTVSSPVTTEVSKVAQSAGDSPSQTSPGSQVTTDNAPLHETKKVDVIEKTIEATKTEVGLQTQTLPMLPKANETPLSTEIAPKLANTARATENKQNAPSVATNKVDSGLNTTGIDTIRTNATDFGHKLSSQVERPTVSGENKKTAQAKQFVEGAKDASTDNSQVNAPMEPNQTLQQPDPAPQSIDDAIKAVIPQAVVLEHSVSRSVLGHSTNIYPTQSSKSESKPNAEEPAPVNTNTAHAISDTSSSEALNTTRPTPPVELNSKMSNGKGKTDVAVKKTQRNSTENQSEATTVTHASHRVETNADGATQSATSKNHDAITLQVNTVPHAKSASAKNTPEASDLSSPGATQVPDIDDITPPSHAGVNTAKLVQGLTQSELRVGLQTRDFGNIDIRTSANHHEFSAQISVEHSEVAHTLTSELPNLYARLNEQQVPVTNIHIHNQSLSTSSGLDQRSQQSSPQQSQSGGFTRQQSEPNLPAVHEMFSSTDRLDVRV